MMHWFRTWRRRAQTPTHRLSALKRLTRRALTYPQLTVDPRGEWSAVQARHVLAIINPQARSFGVEFVTVEITTHASPYRKYILVARCLEHRMIAIAPNTLCVECLRIAHYERVYERISRREVSS